MLALLWHGFCLTKLIVKFFGKKGVKDVQSNAAQRLKTVEGCETLITHLGMTSHRPLAWEQVRAWTEKETIVEAALVVSTLLLAGLFFFSFHQALQNYVVF